MGINWRKLRSRETEQPLLLSRRQKLVDDFIQQYARLHDLVDGYDQLLARYQAIDSTAELEYQHTVTAIRQDFLENSDYRMLSYGDPQDQLDKIERFVGKYSQPLS